MEATATNNQQPTNSTPEDNGSQGEKLFTQADLDRIIGERLGRARTEKKDNAELEAREKALAARENALQCREYLAEKGYPSQLLDVLDITDAETFKQKADKAYSVFGSARGSAPLAPLRSTEPTGGYKDPSGIKSAFSREQTHTPRPFPPHYDEE